MPTGKGLAQTVLLNKGLNSPGLVWTWSIIEATTKRKKEKASLSRRRPKFSKDKEGDL